MAGVSGSHQLSRRTLLLAGGGAALGAITAPATRPMAGWARVPRFGDDPFALGIASGTPRADGMVLWTRLAPSPFEPGGGMPEHPVPVRWEVALDGRFRRVVARGAALARAEAAHSVHAETRGLRPGWEYWYRFRVGREASPVGRMRTLPAVGQPASRFAFAFASCQRFEHGHFSAYRALADDDLDLVVHLGDYIYENAIPAGSTAPRAAMVPEPVRPEATDLDGYRLRHALYKSDAQLQAAHAAVPWAVILDNHDAVWDGDENDPPRNTLVRRAAAYQAWWEHMPLPAADAPRGPSMPIHRRLTVGDLLQLQLLDTRQFRDDEDVCRAPPPNIGPRCAPVLDERRSMLGARQEAWLDRGLGASRALWNAIAQTVLMAEFDFRTGPEESYYLSGWDGYPSARRRLLRSLVDRRARNPVVLSGDWHTQWVNDLRLDSTDESAPVIAAEFVGSAISSDPAFTSSRSAPALSENPHVKYYSDRNGYSRCLLDRRRWRTEFVAVDATRADGTAAVAAAHVVEDGRPGAQAV